jgi:hypothetical protein
VVAGGETGSLLLESLRIFFFFPFCGWRGWKGKKKKGEEEVDEGKKAAEKRAKK